MGDLPGALESYLKFVELGGKSDAVHFNIANIAMRLGNYEMATIHIATAIQMGNQPNYFYLAAKIFRKRGDTTRATKLIETALLMNPSFVEFAKKDEDLKDLI